MKLPLLLLLLPLPMVHGLNITIMEALQTYSPTLYNGIQSVPELSDLLDKRNDNITFLLPNASALNTSIASGLLNFSSDPTTLYNTLSFLTLNGSHNRASLLNKRSFYDTLQPSSAAPISIGPMLNSTYHPTGSIEIYAGLTKAQVTTSDIHCANGLILMIDNFLQQAETPLKTISDLAETEYMEGLLKALNISDAISGSNQTIFVPTNDAWSAANGNTLPFGTLVHNIKYLTLDGVYTSDQFLATTATTQPKLFYSEYQHKPISIGLQQNKLVINRGAATIVKTDILTTSGVIHLIDNVISADSLSSQNDTVSSSSPDEEGNSTDNTPAKALPMDSRGTSGRCHVFIASTLLIALLNTFLLL